MLTEWQINQEMNKRGYVCDKLTDKYARYYNSANDKHIVVFKKGKYTKQLLKVLAE